MKDQIISFETAKLAKEKGFDERIFCFYSKERELYISYPHECFYGLRKLSEACGFRMSNSNIVEGIASISFECVAPTQSLLQRWLRETHNIEVQVSWEQSMKWFYSIGYLFSADEMIVKELDDLHIGQEQLESYETALEVGLIESLNIIKS